MAENTYQHVRSRYGDIAKRTGTTIHDKEDDIALAFGYSAQDLHALPDKANLGLSCGNPVAHANIKEGETIVDLGSGGGIDVLLAARKVGPEGTAIGIDMTKDMINLAKKNAEAAGLSNTRFIEATITSIPLPDASVDCIISNCVINLVPSKDKPTVFQEIARLLKPGGRVAISDILARKELPAKIVNDMALYVGCIAGASQVAEYEEYLKRAGFKSTYFNSTQILLFVTNMTADILIVDTKSDLNLYKQSSYLGQSSCCGPAGSCKALPAEYAEMDFNEWQPRVGQVSNCWSLQLITAHSMCNNSSLLSNNFAICRVDLRLIMSILLAGASNIYHQQIEPFQLSRFGTAFTAETNPNNTGISSNGPTVDAIAWLLSALNIVIATAITS
ncbi:putative ubiE/COQ5 methyltransferase [Aspergillus fumigatus Af293]|uniref:Arsenite methyltransferase n=2 Tax=Aspergillus fumigatus TaxID=746128 RepID=Q4WBV7_ASPFU|nr:ubiE/COQ5 methyltransferase, putative [Aspergillus fumigatus Af293]EAL85427.1 ubiE/COQ5 methyltransferase, putative [Aspergillus fumigatus Af293]EDP48674.1 ubiE/COQ5 methyltransferase, putative [Aspergillus fumigatus A1163]